MRFKDFVEVKFVVEGINISITEDFSLSNIIRDKVKSLANQIVYRYSEVPTKKYKVSLQYPRSGKQAKLGHYLPDNIYIYASSSKEAKEKTERYIRNKLEPVENDETRRYPKDNYLKKAKSKHLDIKAKQVRSWDDFTDSINNIDYLDDKDFDMLIKTSKKRNFVDLLQRLTKKEQKKLKFLYFRGVDQEMPEELTQTMNLLGSKKIGHLPEKEKPIPGQWNYWSVFEPKTQEEIDKLVMGIGETKQVFDIANKFGISVKDLRAVKDDLFKAENEYLDNMRMLYKWLRKSIKVSPTNKLFESDWSNPLWVKKYGVHWDTLIQTLMGPEGAEVGFPFTDKENPDETKSSSDAQEWVWDFYKKGMPQKRPQVEQWTEALKHMLDYRDRVKETPF